MDAQFFIGLVMGMFLGVILLGLALPPNVRILRRFHR
jgi:hypothetical protein